MKVKEIMSQPVIGVREGATLEEIVRLMLEHRIGCVPVIDDRGKLRGIITESDFMVEERYLPFSALRLPQLFGRWVPKEGIEQIYRVARTLTARELMTTPVLTLTEAEPVRGVVDLMLRHEVHHVPVVRDGVPVGIVARHDLLRMMAREGTATAAKR